MFNPLSSETFLFNNLTVPIVGLYLGHVVHAVAAHNYEMRAVLVEGAGLKVAIIGVGHLEAGETPLTAKVVVDSLHEVELRFLVLWLRVISCACR